MAQRQKVVAIGEIGLDYHYDHSDRAKQRNAFEQQLQIAIDLDMPIVVHTREADDANSEPLPGWHHTVHCTH